MRESRQLHVCLICIEFFGNGVFGGFGRATRIIGRELSRRGIKVTVIVPRRSGEHPGAFDLDGMTVLQFNPLLPWAAMELYRSCKADIFHSQDPSLGTYLALVARPHGTHLITFRDPMDKQDWNIEMKSYHLGKMGFLKYRYYIDNPLTSLAVRSVRSLYCAAEFLIPKVRLKYALKRAPGFLPTPVNVPGAVSKAERPTVCFVSRWDGRKRPEQFFELARNFPETDFIAVGGSNDAKRDHYLRSAYGSIPNLEMTGTIDQFRSGELFRILRKSWVLVNTSPREGLPNAFLEAAAHKCAILSYTDPDGFASKFGRHVKEEGLREGLAALLANGRWQKLGEEGHRHVREVFSMEKAIEEHIEVYNRLLTEGL
jgi:glycosyltransferase involved in cell wall biosynthesis